MGKKCFALSHPQKRIYYQQILSETSSFANLARTTFYMNISINFLDVVINNEVKKAIQLGTVMTHPDYRRKGLAKKLLTYVIDKFQYEVNLFYLYANKCVMDFYPKFGFQLKEETNFSIPVKTSQLKPQYVRKLDISNKIDLDLLLKLTKDKYPISKILDTVHDEHLLSFIVLMSFMICCIMLKIMLLR